MKLNRLCVCVCVCVCAGYMLEPDPDKRPTIWQVNEVVCRLQGKTNTMPNVFVSIVYSMKYSGMQP